MSDGYARLWRDLRATESDADAADLPLFGGSRADRPLTHTLARRTDPGTSHAAAEAAGDGAAHQRDQILAALHEVGPMTCDEIDQHYEWRPTTAGRRMHELCRRGRVRSTGEERPTRSGRLAEVFEVTP